jgi:ABC-type bacteriocin/lantibiotic exporter with double-glycine peptidase domain
VIVLAIARATAVYGLARIEDPSTRFTLQRVLNLVVALVIAVIVISVIFVNWYAALAALGLGSILIIIGLAVQTPMTFPRERKYLVGSHSALSRRTA